MNSCYHSKCRVFNIDSNIYRDKSKTWNFKVADLQCRFCDKQMRGIKKICIDHNIEQNWEIIESVYCDHDVVSIKNIKSNNNIDIDNINRINSKSCQSVNTARAECVACKISIPIKSEDNIKSGDRSKWMVDRKKHIDELAVINANKANKK